MLKITLELYPFGKASLKKHLGTMLIGNDLTGTLAQGNYQVKISTDNPQEIWKQGEVKGFPREELTAWNLVKWALDELLTPKDLETLYEEDLVHTCETCGAILEIVRPGKYQCPKCE